MTLRGWSDLGVTKVDLARRGLSLFEGKGADSTDEEGKNSHIEGLLVHSKNPKFSCRDADEICPCQRKTLS